MTEHSAAGEPVGITRLREIWQRRTPEDWSQVILGAINAAESEFAVGAAEHAACDREYEDAGELLKAVQSLLADPAGWDVRPYAPFPTKKEPEEKKE